jgi:hypothetical protein
MKFKSAEADWNISFVSQAGRGRNLWRFWVVGQLAHYRIFDAEVVSTGRKGVSVLGR